MAPLDTNSRAPRDRLILRIPKVVEAVAEGRMAVIVLAGLGLAVFVLGVLR